MRIEKTKAGEKYASETTEISQSIGKRQNLLQKQPKSVRALASDRICCRNSRNQSEHWQATESAAETAEISQSIGKRQNLLHKQPKSVRALASDRICCRNSRNQSEHWQATESAAETAEISQSIGKRQNLLQKQLKSVRALASDRICCKQRARLEGKDLQERVQLQAAYALSSNTCLTQPPRVEHPRSAAADTHSEQPQHRSR
jgi:NTP pyrophosphatase (non-canonical NTP hydrolase)